MKTIAFVLGNNDYFEGAQLKCAVNDATEMAAIFRRLGYDVFEKPLHSQGFYDIILRSQKSTHMAV